VGGVGSISVLILHPAVPAIHWLSNIALPFSLPEFTKTPRTIYVKFQLCPQTPIHVYPSPSPLYENFLNPPSEHILAVLTCIHVRPIFLGAITTCCSFHLSIDCPWSSSVTVCVDWINPPASSADIDQIAKFRVLRFHHSVEQSTSSDRAFH